MALALTMGASAMVPDYFNVPDVPGYVTLKGDFHNHTVFSDASQWPTSRVVEAAYDDLDIFAITDHVETRHRKMVKKGLFTESCTRNTSFEIASSVSKKYGVRVLHGCEITCGQRIFPGHFNAHFISDGEKIADAQDAYLEKNSSKKTAKNEQELIRVSLEAARAQKAFISWNHPNWAPQEPNTPEWTPFVDGLYKDGLFDAIEIVNQSVGGICKEGFHWCIEKNLACVSGTDCHAEMSEIVDYQRGEHRVMTLVFAKENSEEAIREALDARRTAVVYEDCVYGPEAVVEPFFKACFKISNVKATKSAITFTVENVSSCPLLIKKAPGSENLCFERLRLSPGEKVKYSIKPVHGGKTFGFSECDYNIEVENFFVDADVPLKVGYHFSIAE